MTCNECLESGLTEADRPHHAVLHMAGTANIFIEDNKENTAMSATKKTTPTPLAYPPVTPITAVAAPAKRAKRQHLTAQEWKTRREFATSVVGYDQASPIYGKQMPEVLQLIEDQLSGAAPNVAQALVIVTELKKRIATRKIMAQA